MSSDYPGAADVLKVALPEAQAWCAPRARRDAPELLVDEPDPTLRSMRLYPDPFTGSPTLAVRSVVERRWYALGLPKREDYSSSLSLNGGRLLLYDPEINLTDGAACALSKGFFDVNNAPPWDTWLCLSEKGLLIAWVPPALLERADLGVEVNPEQCIRWASATDLAALGLS